MDGVQPDTATTPHRHRGTGFDLRTIHNGTDAGDDRTTDETRLFQRCVVRNFDTGIDMSNGLFSKGWSDVVNRFAIFRHAAYETGDMCLTQGSTTVTTVATVTAHGIKREDNLVPGRDASHTGTDLSDDTRAFVSHDPRGRLTLDMTIHVVVVAVTNTRANDIKQYFTRLRWLDFEFFNRYRNVGLVKDRCFHGFLQFSHRVWSDVYLFWGGFRSWRYSVIAVSPNIRPEIHSAAQTQYANSIARDGKKCYPVVEYNFNLPRS